MEKPDPINPALRQRLEDRKRARAPWLYNRPPAPPDKTSGDEGGKLVLFWFAYFIIFGGLALYFGRNL